MKIRTKILLLGALSTGCVISILVMGIAEKLAVIGEHDRLLRCLPACSAISRVVHELQKERGLSVGFVASQERSHGEAVERQREETDRQWTDAAPIIEGCPSTFITDETMRLAALREDIDARRTTAQASQARYTDLIGDLIGVPAIFLRLPLEHSVHEMLEAHQHLIVAKEYLGQIRANLIAALQSGQVDADLAMRIAALKGRHDAHLNIFGRVANDASRVLFQRVARVERMRATFEFVDSVLATGSQQATPARAGTWFEIVSRAIDDLHDVENAARGDLAAATHEVLGERRRLALVHLVGMAGFAIVGLLAGAMVTVTLLAALDSLRARISDIALNRNFGLRLPETPMEEVGVIARAFNGLLVVAEEVIAEKDLASATDPLTGLWNRSKLSAVIDHEVDRSTRFGQPLSLVMADVDFFKRVNDTFGHDVGDQVLIGVADALRRIGRAADVVARFGGEEFVVLLPNTNAYGAAVLAEKCRAALAATEFPTVGAVTASFGVAGLRDGDTSEILFVRADRALFTAKREGRNRVHLAPFSDNEPALDPAPETAWD